ncbi:MAG: dTDP-4-amino-4,6-dideoxygalactose transaminase [Capsulimonadaceae bacterium]|nr:dTDP-4-amino-4,6-dideoxygalactose transaminase [Capsulimonadaceae bacterium]
MSKPEANAASHDASAESRIPFNRPSMVGNEAVYMMDAVRLGHAAGDGAYTRKCRMLLEEALSLSAALLTTSCTHALELAAILLNISPGDEVIVPSFTFVSTANAFVLRGAKPVFADIREDTLNMDETALEALVTANTRAVVPVHYAGIGCEMDEICRIAAAHSVPVVEDNAHGLFGKYRGRYLGTFGELATLSFHETKNFSCGEGGALLINDQQYVNRAEIVREKGTNRSAFFRGAVDKYTWVDIGSSYPPSDILAAYLLAQLEARDAVLAARRRVWETYHEQLSSWAKAFGAKQPTVPAHCESSYHMYHLVLPTARDRDALIEHLRRRNILAVFHYVPLHLSPMGLQLGGQPGQCPVAESISERLVRLPFFNSLLYHDQMRVIDAVVSFSR